MPSLEIQAADQRKVRLVHPAEEGYVAPARHLH